MNDDRFESYSALLDGELESAEEKRLLDQLADDHQARNRIGRYGLIADGLRGEPVRVDALSVADAVRKRLQQEPVVLAPRPQRKPARPAWWQPAAGIAIAASVALVAVGLMPRLLSDAPEAGSAPVQVVGVPAIQAMPVSATTGTHWSQSRPEQESRLNRYLAEHNEFATQGGLPGIVPYATFVSYDGKE
jgi:sigma-E factor negative regulatory protein RseA